MKGSRDLRWMSQKLTLSNRGSDLCQKYLDGFLLVGTGGRVEFQ